MGRNSQYSGVSGAVRIQRLSGTSLAAAESHGKRRDDLGEKRSIIKEPPLTTTGLNLRDLYDEHVEGAKVQRSSTKALHLVFQFPKELVNGEDAETMLREARAFAVSIFGDAAIFADRVDRDEKSRHVVDLFVAPRYQKTTKRRTQAAVSTSKHLKALAQERTGDEPTLRVQGQVLQDLWFEHLRDRMKLEGVHRGEKKRVPWEDWQTPEELALEEREEAVQAQEAEADRMTAEAAETLSEARTEAQSIIEAATPAKFRQIEAENSRLKAENETLKAFHESVRATLGRVLGERWETIRQTINREWSFSPKNPASAPPKPRGPEPR